MYRGESKERKKGILFYTLHLPFLLLLHHHLLYILLLVIINITIFTIQCLFRLLFYKRLKGLKTCLTGSFCKKRIKLRDVGKIISQANSVFKNVISSN